MASWDCRFLPKRCDTGMWVAELSMWRMLMECSDGQKETIRSMLISLRNGSNARDGWRNWSLSLSPSLSFFFSSRWRFLSRTNQSPFVFSRVRRNHSRLPFHFTYFNAMKVDGERESKWIQYLVLIHYRKIWESPFSAAAAGRRFIISCALRVSGVFLSCYGRLSGSWLWSFDPELSSNHHRPSRPSTQPIRLVPCVAVRSVSPNTPISKYTAPYRVLHGPLPFSDQYDTLNTYTKAATAVRYKCTAL